MVQARAGVGRLGLGVLASLAPDPQCPASACARAHPQPALSRPSRFNPLHTQVWTFSASSPAPRLYIHWLVAPSFGSL